MEKRRADKNLNFKKIWKKIPKLPLSGFIFYLVVLTLWSFNIIPPPHQILIILENLYNSYGLIGLFIAIFLESIVYLGLYFPGSFIVALAVILSDGTFKSLFTISVIIALTLTLTAIINYNLGKRIPKKKSNLIKNPLIPKGLLISILHPNALAFYFFASGIKKENSKKILLVPVLMIPYGLILAYIFYFLKESIKTIWEGPYLVILIVLIWGICAFFYEKKIKKFHKNL